MRVDRAPGARAPILVAALAGLLLAGCARERAPAVVGAEQGAELPWEIREATLRSLAAIGYSGATGEPAWGGGIRLHRKERVWRGLNLWASGHAPVAFLTDMEGRTRKRWRYRRPRPGQALYVPLRRAYWQRVRALANGDLVGLFAGVSLVKLDRRSNLLWGWRATVYDFDLSASGELVALTTEEIPAGSARRPGRDVVLVWLSPGGEETRRLSLADGFERSAFARPWAGALRASGARPVPDRVHLLDGGSAARPPALAAGSVLVSLAAPGALAVVDPAAGEVVWFRRDRSRRTVSQVLPSGRLLVVEHGDGGSRVVETDLDGGEPIRVYPSAADRAFYSAQRGAAQRLPNGNTLVTESDRGRAFEIDPDGSPVWEFVNPSGTGPVKTYRASLMEMERLPVRFFDGGGSLSGVPGGRR